MTRTLRNHAPAFKAKVALEAAREEATIPDLGHLYRLHTSQKRVWKEQLHRVFPYLLAGVPIGRPKLVWAADLIVIPMPAGFAYLVAILDVYSRRVLAWRLPNTMEARFCVDALHEAIDVVSPRRQVIWSPNASRSGSAPGGRTTTSAPTSRLVSHLSFRSWSGGIRLEGYHDLAGDAMRVLRPLDLLRELEEEAWMP